MVHRKLYVLESCYKMKRCVPRPKFSEEDQNSHDSTIEI